MRVETIDLDLTNKCNLKCSYCYRSCDEIKEHQDMSNETMELVFDFIERFGFTKQNGNSKPTHITFYGGEPLLSFERVQYFVNRAEERGMRLTYSILSNGTTGTKEQVNWLQANNIWCQRSIDGYPEAQEKYRPNSIDLYRKQNDLWKDYDHSRRSTIQPEFAKDLLKSQKFFESMGFENGVAQMPNYYTEWTEQQTKDFCGQLLQTAIYYIEMWKKDKPFYNYYFCKEIVNRFHYNRSVQFGCGGGIGLYCVRNDGYLYLCHRFAQDDPKGDFCYGHLKDILEDKVKGLAPYVTKEIDRHIKNTPDVWDKECKDCIAQYGCEKGCMHSNYYGWNSKDITKRPRPYCEIRKTASRAVAFIDSKLRSIDPQWWLKGATVQNKQEFIKQYQNKDCKGGCNTCQDNNASISPDAPPRPQGATSLWCEPNFPENKAMTKWVWK